MPETVEQIPEELQKFVSDKMETSGIHFEEYTDYEFSHDLICKIVMADRSRRPSSKAGKGEALLREALAWYGDEAASLAKSLGSVSMAEALSMNNADRNRIEAVLTVLGLDAGKRARTALQPGHKP